MKRIFLVAAMLLKYCIVTNAQEVIPDFYKGPGLDPNRSYVNQNFNEHIDPFTGSLQLHYVDISLPGNGGFDLQVKRSYNSSQVQETNPNAFYGSAGVGWTIHFGRVMYKSLIGPCGGSLYTHVLNNAVLELPDGSTQILAVSKTPGATFISTQRWKAECTPSGMTVYSPDGIRYDMNQSSSVLNGTPAPFSAYYTTKITDRNGNTASIAYKSTGSPEVATVQTSDGRRVDFAYLPRTATESIRRISTITSIDYGTGHRVFTYGYTAIAGIYGGFQLTSVTRPDGTQWLYDYNGYLSIFNSAKPGGFMLNKVTYPQGGTISYGYGQSQSDYVYFDSVRQLGKSTVIKEKSTGDGGIWRLEYSPGSLGVYDKTTVTTPSGTVIYRHVGPNYAVSESLWKIGLLMEKQVGSMQSESYTWAPQVVSNQDFKRPGAWQATIYDSNVYAALLVSKTIVRDGASHSTTYSDPDLYGNPRSITESGPNGGFRTTNLTYFQGAVQWILRQVQNETVLGGTQITRDFDIKGNLRSVVKDNVTTGYSYDANGNVSQATFPRGLIQSYSAYKLGIPQLEIQPEAISISRTVSDSGNVLSEKNARGYTTYYEHDGLNRLTKITSPRGNPTRIKYEKASTTAIRCPLNVIQCDLTESTLYDGFGRVKKVTLGGIERSYSPDFLGRIVFVSDPGASSGTYYSYDIIDRVTNVLNADSKSRTIKFDPGKKKVTDERGHSIIYDYRAYGDPSGQFLMAVSSSAEPSVNLIIGRDGRDSVISVKQGGFTRTYDYDGRGYLKSVVNPETGTTLYERDDANNIKSRKTGNSGMTFFDYDFRNRLKNVIYPGSTPSVSNTYTKTDRLETVISSVASRSFGYDENDNLRSESLTVDGQNFVLGYGYNENDQLSSLIYPRSGRVLDYSPDALGRPAQVSGFVNSVTYWPSGQLKQVNYANGTASNYGQNSRLWPSSFQTGRGAIGYLNSSYTYDGVGNLNTISDSVDAGYNRTLDYDGVNRLRIANGPWGSGSLSYDGTGNLRSQSFGSRSLTYNYNTINQLASISGAQVATFSYDVFGNVIGNGVKTFNYDDAPNMSCADCGSAAGAQYQYDGLNQRVSTLKAGVKTLEFYSSNGNLLSELTPSLSNRLAEYIYLGGKRVATIGPSPVSISLPTQIPIAAAGQAFTVTATLAGGVSPSGTVRFFDGPSLLGTIGVFSGKATVSTTFLTLGAHSLTATYSGDAVNFGSSTSATVTVLNSTGIAPAEGAVFSALAGKLTVLSATVTGNSPTGTMSFYDGNVLLGTASLVAGKGSLNTTITTVGLHTITFVYSGDANNPGSSTSATLNVTLPVESLMPILQILLLDD